MSRPSDSHSDPNTTPDRTPALNAEGCVDSRHFLAENPDPNNSLPDVILLHLGSCTSCQAYYDNLRQVQSALQQAEIGPLDSGEEPCFWDTIAQTLETDVQQASASCHYTAKTVQDYYQGNFSQETLSEALLPFEQHLNSCPPCSEALAQLLSQSEQQQEALLIRDQKSVQECTQGRSIQRQWEYLSPLLDQSLSTKLQLAEQAHLEQCSACQNTFSGLVRLHTLIQESTERIQATAPDFWPVLAPILQQEQAKSVVSLSQRRLNSVWLKASAIAAAVLFTLWIPFQQEYSQLQQASNQPNATQSELAYDTQLAAENIPSAEAYLMQTNSQSIPTEELSATLGAP